MRRDHSKFVLELAASNKKLSEINDFLTSVEQDGAQHFVNLIDSLRTLSATDFRPIYGMKGPSGRDAQRLSAHKATIDKIERLLIKEAGLPKTQAAQFLYHELSISRPEQSLPSPKKIAFRLWLSRLLDDAPQSEVMHVASKVRNKVVHGSRNVSDWPLSDEY